MGKMLLKFGELLTFEHETPEFIGNSSVSCTNSCTNFVISLIFQGLLRRERVMNLLSYILEIQFIIKMSMP